MLLAFLAALPQGPLGSTQTADAAITPGSPRIGVYLDDPGTLSSFEGLVGRKADIFLWYQSINEDLDPSLTSIAAGNRTIQISWEPRLVSGDPVNQPAYRLRNITAGIYDADIHRWARELRAFGYPVLFRPMCEMNGDWSSWSGTANGNQPADYIPAWRHIHDIFAAEGATNVRFVWSPNVDGDTAAARATFATYYPGDAYVDYVGMNGYNWGSLSSTSTWTSTSKSLAEIFGPSYDTFAALTSKPLMISETASTEVGVDKAAWIADAFASLPLRFPRIDSITWFDVIKETDWRVNSSPASLQAYRAAVDIADSQPPSVIIKAPKSGSVLSGTAPVSVTATDNVAVARIDLYLGDRLVASASGGNLSTSLATRALADGSYTLTAKAYDFAGNSGSASASVTFDNSTDTDYCFNWYDDASPGMLGWLVLSNPGATAQHAEVYIAGQLQAAYDIPARQSVTPRFGIIGGPVKVAVTGGGALLVSERNLYNGTLSELPATGRGDLSPDQLLGWYDQVSPGMQSWVMVSNQGSQATQANIAIGGRPVGSYPLAPGQVIAPQFAGVMAGPVEVTSSNGQPLGVSERVVLGSAFNEVAGRSSASLTSEYLFSWYDEQTAGMYTWVVVNNRGSQATTAQIYLGSRLIANLTLQPGQTATPRFPGLMDGPMRVVSTNGQPLLVSQRSTFNSSFQEIAGRAPLGLGSDSWFSWYDQVSPGMITWVLVSNLGSAPDTVDIAIGSNVVGSYLLSPGDRITPTFPGWRSGPMEVRSRGGQPLIVSQRSIYYGSFGEMPGRTG